jgi:hypothetical protein
MNHTVRLTQLPTMHSSYALAAKGEEDTTTHILHTSSMQMHAHSYNKTQNKKYTQFIQLARIQMNIFMKCMTIYQP